MEGLLGLLKPLREGVGSLEVWLLTAHGHDNDAQREIYPHRLGRAIHIYHSLGSEQFTQSSTKARVALYLRVEFGEDAMNDVNPTSTSNPRLLQTGFHRRKEDLPTLTYTLALSMPLLQLANGIRGGIQKSYGILGFLSRSLSNRGISVGALLSKARSNSKPAHSPYILAEEQLSGAS